MKIPAVSDKIDFTQYIDPKDPSGVCMVHIPYNLFCIWREQGKQEVLEQALKDFRKLTKEFQNQINERLENKNA